jgi:hypothetical protein
MCSLKGGDSRFTQFGFHFKAMTFGTEEAELRTPQVSQSLGDV